VGVSFYKGRFAPSPTGPLHAGSLVAALASWLDARAHGGQWLVRIEDVDRPRTVTGMDEVILQQLAALGLQPDAAPLWQSRRDDAYQRALDQLVTAAWAYPCHCSRKDVEATIRARSGVMARHTELVYPGTCRPHHAVPTPEPSPAAATAWRFRTDLRRTDLQTSLPGANASKNQAFSLVKYVSTAIKSVASEPVEWPDRRLGTQRQQVEAAVGDFPLKRADGCFTYQLAVVVDDAFQGITHVVRGQDLADNTARQILLQKALGVPTPRYLHTPLVLGSNGEKLSKQNGAAPLDLIEPTQALTAAAQTLGLRAPIDSTAGKSDGAGLLAAWVQEWRALYNPAREHHSD
jgi:glutamyl-Q tRNA(Asp) synthetase